MDNIKHIVELIAVAVLLIMSVALLITCIALAPAVTFFGALVGIGIVYMSGIAPEDDND